MKDKPNRRATLDLHRFAIDSARHRDENLRFLRSLPTIGRNKVAAAAAKAHQYAFEKIDCLDCAHCCISLGPSLNQHDIGRIASFLNISRAKMLSRYLEMDEDGDFVFRQLPCPFLQDDKRCSIYEVRPQSCRQYPHTDGSELYDYRDIAEENIKYCPALFEVLDQLKKHPF